MSHSTRLRPRLSRNEFTTPNCTSSMNFQNRPTTIGESIIGIRNSVVIAPRPLMRREIRNAIEKPRIVCRPTAPTTKISVVSARVVDDRRREDVRVVVEPDDVVTDVARRAVVGERQADQLDQRPDREEQQQRERRADEQPGELAVREEREAAGGGRRHQSLGLRLRSGAVFEACWPLDPRQLAGRPGATSARPASEGSASGEGYSPPLSSRIACSSAASLSSAASGCLRCRRWPR